MRRGLITITFVLLAAGAFAQSTGFRVGGRFGVGVSQYTRVEGIDMQNGRAIEGGLALSLQPVRFFAIESYPAISGRNASATGSRSDVDVNGNPAQYSFTDNYRIISADVPVLAKLSLGLFGIRMVGFAGPGMSFRMAGYQSRTFDDAKYNGQQGYNNRKIELNPTETFGVLGVGVQIGLGESVVGVDARYRRGFSPTGKIDGDEFNANTLTFGLTFYR